MSHSSRAANRPTSAGGARARRVAVVLAVAVAVLAGIAAVALMAGPAPVDPAPRILPAALDAAPTPSTVRGCGEQRSEQPAALPLWCATPSQRLDNLAWSGWGGRTATATGDLQDTPCFCVGESTRQYPVTVRLQAPGSEATGRVYTRLSVSFPGARPDWAYRADFTFDWTPSGYLSEETT